MRAEVLGLVLHSSERKHFSVDGSFDPDSEFASEAMCRVGQKLLGERFRWKRIGSLRMPEMSREVFAVEWDGCPRWEERSRFFCEWLVPLARGLLRNTGEFDVWLGP